MVDSHAHLSGLGERGMDLEAFFREWILAGGGLIVDIGTVPGDLPRRLETAGAALSRARASLAKDAPAGGPGVPRDSAQVLYTAGAWPDVETVHNPERSLARLREDLDSGAACALGEVGLDYNHRQDDTADQVSFFRSCAELAAERGLPLIVHSRDAFEDTREVMRDLARAAARGGPSGERVIHCFSYGPDEARAFLDSGCYISFSGNVTYKNARPIAEAAALVPLDRMLVETDAPWLTPVPHRGKRPSTPLDTVHVVDFIAKERGVDPAVILAGAERNARDLFDS